MISNSTRLTSYLHFYIHLSTFPISSLSSLVSAPFSKKWAAARRRFARYFLISSRFYPLIVLCTPLRLFFWLGSYWEGEDDFHSYTYHCTVSLLGRLPTDAMFRQMASMTMEVVARQTRCCTSSQKKKKDETIRYSCISAQIFGQNNLAFNCYRGLVYFG